MPLRLVGVGGEGSPPSSQGNETRELELSIREREGGAILFQMLLRIPRFASIHGDMRLSPSVPGEGKDAAPHEPREPGSPHAPHAPPAPAPVAGRIEARRSELDLAIDQWHARLTARKLRCAGEYRAVLRKALREEGWASFADFEAGALAYLDAKVNSGDWKGVTYNRNLVVVKSFSAFQAKLRGVKDLIEDADWAEDDRGDPTRAPTLDEARAIVRYAAARALVDRKVTPETPLSLAVALGMGLRPRELDKWRWKHLKLDADPPHVWWTKEIQKNKRQQAIAMSAEMAGLLREHRARRLAGATAHVRRCKFRAAQIRGVDPRDPEAFVFGETFSHSTFRKYVERCGLAGADGYGRRLTPRSCRKFYKTEMLRQGVAGDMLRRLMRHKLNADEGYFAPTLGDMAAAADRLPRLWPASLDQAGADGGCLVDNPALHDVELTRSSRRCNSVAARPDAQHPPQPLEKTAGASRQGTGLATDPAGSSVGGFLEALSQPVLSPGGGGAVRSPGVMNPAMAQPRFISEPDRTALADLLGALERLLRGAAHEHEHSPRNPSHQRRAGG